MKQTYSNIRAFFLYSLALASCLPTAIVAEKNVTTITLGQYVDYPPYAFETADGELAGFGKDFADGMSALCEDIQINVVKEEWANCWTSEGGGMLGDSLASETELDGCMTYTHSLGVRDTFADFSDAMLNDNKPAGLLTLLDEGKPKVTGLSDLSGKTIIDVAGWAPTADALGIVVNQCTNENYSEDFELVSADGDIANDVAMQMLRDGEGDAIFIYADQVAEYSQCPEGAAWNCTLWEGFGVDIAYVQTGQFGYTINGTTLALSRKGSGIRELLRPCMQAFMQSEEYYNICVKHDLTSSCYPNNFFGNEAKVSEKFDQPTSELTGDCSDGYCPCPETEIETAPDDTNGSSVLRGTVFFVASSILWLFL